VKNGVSVIGAGGHAKVVVSTMIAAGIGIKAILDDDPGKWGNKLFGVKIDGPISSWDGEEKEPAVLAIGDNSTRMKFARLLGGRMWRIVIHPHTYIHPTVQIGEGTVVFAGAIIQPDVRIGAHCIINSGATIDHDSVIGDYAHVAPGVNLAGNVRLGDGVFLGIGSAVIVGKHVGEWTVVGAGAVVVTDLPAHAVAAGLPAKVISY
jgi:sugar O-acyltransferase (sialic acid O-acetyltransferase NeuD family)